jgi:hypothetical protein
MHVLNHPRHDGTYGIPRPGEQVIQRIFQSFTVKLLTFSASLYEARRQDSLSFKPQRESESPSTSCRNGADGYANQIIIYIIRTRSNMALSMPRHAPPSLLLRIALPPLNLRLPTQRRTKIRTLSPLHSFFLLLRDQFPLHYRDVFLLSYSE